MLKLAKLLLPLALLLAAPSAARAEAAASFTASPAAVAELCRKGGGMATADVYGCLKANCDSLGGECRVTCATDGLCVGRSPDTCAPMTHEQFFGLAAFVTCSGRQSGMAMSANGMPQNGPGTPPGGTGMPPGGGPGLPQGGGGNTPPGSGGPGGSGPGGNGPGGGSGGPNGGSGPGGWVPPDSIAEPGDASPPPPPPPPPPPVEIPN